MQYFDAFYIIKLFLIYKNITRKKIDQTKTSIYNFMSQILKLKFSSINIVKSEIYARCKCCYLSSHSWMRSNRDLSSRGPWYMTQAEVMIASPGAEAICLRVFFSSDLQRKCCIDIFSIRLLALAIRRSMALRIKDRFNY